MRQASTTQGINIGNLNIKREIVIGFILAVSLIAFEAFNFDTTRFALRSLLGDIHFFSFSWASILAVAFCSIDFAGLVRFFTPDKHWHKSREFLFMMGAWFLGATMNATMTWWSISLSLLNHQFGNEVLSREELLKIVPIFVAILVWLTRVLFIGGIAVAGDKLFKSKKRSNRRPTNQRRRKPTRSSTTRKAAAKPRRYQPEPAIKSKSAPVSSWLDEDDEEDDDFLEELEYEDDYDSTWTPVNRNAGISAPSNKKPANTRRSPRPASRPPARNRSGNGRRQRPPMPPINTRIQNGMRRRS